MYTTCPDYFLVRNDDIVCIVNLFRDAAAWLELYLCTRSFGHQRLKSKKHFKAVIWTMSDNSVISRWKSGEGCGTFCQDSSWFRLSDRHWCLVASSAHDIFQATHTRGACTPSIWTAFLPDATTCVLFYGFPSLRSRMCLLVALPSPNILHMSDFRKSM